MYKFVFVVAVFAFVFQQGALDKINIKIPAIPNSAGISGFNSPLTNNAPAAENKPNENPETTSSTSSSAPTISTSTESQSSTTPKTSGVASSSEICVLLVQVSSLALVVKHALI